MKTIDELTEKEILSLTDSEVQNLIKLEMMECNIPLTMNKPELGSLDIPEPTVECFCINDMYFSSKEAAEDVANVLKRHKKDFHSVDFGFYDRALYAFRTGLVDTEVKIVSVYPEGTKISDIVNKIKEADEKRKDENSKYIEWYDKKAKIEERVLESYNKVIGKYRRLDYLTEVFKVEYFPLSKDEKLAMAYMDKAYNLTEEEKEYIISNYKEE